MLYKLTDLLKTPKALQKQVLFFSFRNILKQTSASPYAWPAVYCALLNRNRAKHKKNQWLHGLIQEQRNKSFI